MCFPDCTTVYFGVGPLERYLLDWAIVINVGLRDTPCACWTPCIFKEKRKTTLAQHVYFTLRFQPSDNS